MEAALGGFHLREDARCVIGADFVVAGAARPSTDGVGGRFQGDGFKARGVVGAYGGGDDVEEGGARGANAEGALSADHGRAEVEGVAAGAGKE